MSNRSYKDRIKNYKVEKDTEAWSQMSALLDNLSTDLPVDKKEKKKQRGWLWLALGLAFLIIIAYFTFDYLTIGENVLNTDKANVPSVSNTQSNLSIEDKEKDDDINVNEISNNLKQDSRNISVIDTSTYLPINNGYRTTSNDNQTQIETRNLTTPNKQLNMEKTADDKTKALSKKSNFNNEYQAKNNFSSNSNDIEIKSGDNELLIAESDQSNVIGGQDNLGDFNQEPTSQDDSQINQDSGDEESNTVEPLLKIPPFGIDYLSRDIEQRPMLIDPATISRRRLSLFGSGGYAKFNNNGGFHFNAGLVYDLNNLLSVESSLSYSRGSDRTRNIGSDFEFERQIEMNLLFHLNLIKTERQKAAILLGPTYVFYKGQRLINTAPNETFDFRNSRGFTATLGVLLTHDISRRWTIGGRVGAIPYDDSVIFYNLLIQYKL
jgi:hypothetical protein